MPRPPSPDGPPPAAGLLEVDLAEWPPTLDSTRGLARVLVLLRWGATPLATVELDCRVEPLTPERLWATANEQVGPALLEQMARQLLQPEEGRSPSHDESPPASATVVICTRDRPDDLERCLSSIRANSVHALDLLVVDNAPARSPADEVAASVGARYVVESRPGLNRARERGARAATGQVVIYIDDDVVVLPGWDRALLSNFADPEVAGVTGLVLPFTVASPAQLLFERMGGFSRGYARRVHTLEDGTPLGAGNVGAGACMAFRRDLVNELALFHAEMDAGSPTLSGGDTYAFYRLLSLGYLLVYDPRVMVRHRHRESIEELRDTLYGYSVGTYCYFLRCIFYHGESFAVVAGLRWFIEHHVRELVRGLRRRPSAQPLSFTAREIAGVLSAPLAFVRATRRERRR